ncbi:hypothetical protein [Streptomyces sp. 5-6(2022)]|uniref:hypothetical protein n=1 Tax=Streptomyces sp. 5-6(2022) TaxID=2936510 RepID=UPI0023B8DB95|nr:hypothetical protein [Streptomyces sp. 5-6(2022)]
MESTNYEGGVVYEFDGESEYVQVEPYEGYFSMAWTTNTSADVISHLHDNIRLDASKGEASGVFLQFGSDGHVVATAKDVVHACSSTPKEIAFARLNFADLAVTWRSERKFSNGNLDPTQCGLIAKRFDPEFIQAILAVTGSGRVANNAPQLVEALGFVRNTTPSGWIGELNDWREG